MCNIPISCNNNLKCAIMYIYINFISGKEESQEKEGRFVRDVVCGPTTFASHGINSECRIPGPIKLQSIL